MNVKEFSNEYFYFMLLFIYFYNKFVKQILPSKYFSYHVHLVIIRDKKKKKF